MGQGQQPGLYGGTTSEVFQDSKWNWGHHSLNPGPHPCQMPAPAPLAPALFPSGAIVLVLGWGKEHTEREWSHLGPDPQCFCSSNLGPAPSPKRVVLATEKGRSPGSHWTLALAAPSAAPPPTEVIAASTL